MAVETVEATTNNHLVQYQGGRAHAAEIIAWMEANGGNGRYLEPVEGSDVPGEEQSAAPEYLIIYLGQDNVLAQEGDWVVLDAFGKFHLVTEEEYPTIFGK